MTARESAPEQRQDFGAWWYDYKIKNGLLSHADRFKAHAEAAWNAARLSERDTSQRDAAPGEVFEKWWKDFWVSSPTVSPSAAAREAAMAAFRYASSLAAAAPHATPPNRAEPTAEDAELIAMLLDIPTETVEDNIVIQKAASRLSALLKAPHKPQVRVSAPQIAALIDKHSDKEGYANTDDMQQFASDLLRLSEELK